jgi:hypothetical protein
MKMDLKLNIYKNNNEIEKTYTATEFDLMWGTIEDLTNAVDLNKLDDNEAVGKMVLAVLPQVKPLLKQIFVGLTDDELKRTKVKELIPIFINAFEYAFSEINLLGGKQGN